MEEIQTNLSEDSATNKNYPIDHPRTVIPQLCRRFYDFGWMTGTGGALGIKQGTDIYITPSGVQKENVTGDDLYIVSSDGSEISAPDTNKKMPKSMCTPLITNVFRKVPNCQAVYHIHSKAAVLVSLVYTNNNFGITQQKLLQVIRKSNTDICFDYYDVLRIPIIENKPREDDMLDQMSAAMADYPEASAVIIRRHGMYVWGPTWEITKAMAEAYDYLFDVAVQMKKFGLDPEVVPEPPEGAYL